MFGIEPNGKTHISKSFLMNSYVGTGIKWLQSETAFGTHRQHVKALLGTVNDEVFC